MRILEVGFGGGNDALHFARAGHMVVATDLSDYAVERCQQSFGSERLRFVQHDTLMPFPFQDQQFDVVYARLALHYFNLAETRRVFREIARLLPPGGRLIFMAKSTQDSMYGVGQQVDEDTYIWGDEQRHFFSSEYAFDLLTKDGLFDAEYIRYRNRRVYGKVSGVLAVSARRSGNASQLLLF